MALFDSRVRPSQQASDIAGLRGKLLTSVFPTVSPTTPANSPASPVAPTDANRTRAQAPAQQSAASRAAAAVSAKLAANPVKPVAAPVKSTRANSQMTQSAGTINTNFVNSAAAQGYTGVTPPNIYRGSQSGVTNPLNPTTLIGERNPNRSREFFRDNVFTPTNAQVRANLFAPVPAPGAILQSPAPAQVGVPAAQFPPRNQFLNYLFPR